MDQHAAAGSPLHGSGSEAPPVRCGRSVGVRPADLASDFAGLLAAGYRAAELSLDSLGCILGGRLADRGVGVVAETCARFSGSLAYSVHSPAVLDLRDPRHPDLHRDILLSSVRFAAAIGARVLVVHYEARSEDPAIEAQYRRAVELAAELAGQHRLVLGIENIEVERADRVLEFLELVRHPWVRMTYDFAHNYLAGDLFGYDHVASAEACAPYAAHLHLTDNFGRFNQARLGDFNLYQAIPYADKIITGLGDLHLPIGWGTLPVDAVHANFARRGYAGLLISEHEQAAFPTVDVEVRERLETLAASAG